MYHFISGYTAKVAGTEAGVTDPEAVFSACFGAPFMPLHPTKYAELLGEKMDQHKVNLWLVNTGWTGGKYGVGKRMSLPHTRALISAAMNGYLDGVDYNRHSVFGLEVPTHCPGVPSEVLDPRATWKNKEGYDKSAQNLAKQFIDNFKQFEEYASDDIMAGGPITSTL